MAKKIPNTIYSAKLQVIAPYIDKKINKRKKNFTAAEKRYISRYFDLFNGTKGEPGFNSRLNITYTPKTAKQKRIIKELSQIPKGYKLKTYPVPSPDANAKIRFDKRGVKIVSKYITRRIYLFDPTKIARGQKEVRRALNKLKAKKYTVLTGKFESWQHVNDNEEDVLKMIEDWKEKYVSKDHNWKDFMFGLAGYEFDNQAEWEDYRRARAEKLKKKRKKKKGKNNGKTNSNN
jgi:hypothetical protein